MAMKDFAKEPVTHLSMDRQGELMIQLKGSLNFTGQNMLRLAEELQQFGTQPLSSRDRRLAKMSINNDLIDLINGELALAILQENQEDVDRALEVLQDQLEFRRLFD